MDRTRLLDALAREADAYTAVVGTADLAAPVEACPGWDLRELTAHVAGTHQWAAGAVELGELRQVPTPPLSDRAAVVDWYRTSADRLLDVLTRTPADAPAPSFTSPNGTASFWLRRQVHELGVHRWDAEHAGGITPVLDEDVAADGVAEVLEVFVPRMRQRGLLGALPHTVALEHPSGRAVVGDGAPVATARGAASTLLLVLWKRLPVDALELTGDADAARVVLNLPLTP